MERFLNPFQDNLSHGNIGAVKVFQDLFPESGRLQFIYDDLGDAKAVNKIFSQNAFDAVMHFATVGYVGESSLDPLKYISQYYVKYPDGLMVLEAMAAHDVNTLIYCSPCATYGEPEKMPITEETPQVPLEPRGGKINWSGGLGNSSKWVIFRTCWNWMVLIGLGQFASMFCS